MIQRLAASALCFAVVASCTVLVIPTGNAHANGTTDSCPAGYDLVGTTPAYCMSDAGDVVRPNGAREVLLCPKGYGRWAQLCFSSTTGDVVLALEDRE